MINHPDSGRPSTSHTDINVSRLSDLLDTDYWFNMVIIAPKLNCQIVTVHFNMINVLVKYVRTVSKVLANDPNAN